jgi:hypothetical protein
MLQEVGRIHTPEQVFGGKYRMIFSALLETYVDTLPDTTEFCKSVIIFLFDALKGILWHP